MDIMPKTTEHLFPFFGTARSRFPWGLALVVLAIVFGVGYSIDSDRSLSERDGVVSQTEADNGVIPSLPPQ